MSSNSMMPVTSISVITTNTTMVGLMKLEPSTGRLIGGFEPVIQRNIASTTNAAMIHSWREGAPISASSLDLQVTISGPSFTCGRQMTSASNGTSSSNGIPSGAKPVNHCDQPISTPAIFLAMLSAAALGASAVKNSELVTAVVPKAVPKTQLPDLPSGGAGSEPAIPGTVDAQGEIRTSL